MGRDLHGRQLNGMGGGVSSLAKVCMLAPSEREDADVDSIFAQVLIREGRVDYTGNCSNMSSAVGPFAVDEGLVRLNGDATTVRISNTNTKKIIHGTFALEDGRAKVAGDIGLTGRELPDQLEASPDILALLDTIRLQASIRMGISRDAEEARMISSVPYIGIVSPPADTLTLSGETIAAAAIDLAARIISNGQPHRALPLTGSLCTAVAARIAGTVVADCLAKGVGDGPLRLGMPSGVLTVGADVVQENGAWGARAGSFYRTARRLCDGRIWV